MSNSDTMIVAIDDGYAQTKSAVYAGDAADCRKFVTHICNGQRLAELMEDQSSVSKTYLADGEYFSIGGRDAGEATRFDGFHVSPLNRVAVTHALFGHDLAGRAVEIVVGLPVRDYFKATGARNDELIEKKKQNLLAPCERVGATANETITVHSVRIASQAVASYIDAAYDFDGNQLISPEEDTVIVDIGGRTTDVALIVEGSRVDMAHSGTENIGVLDVHAELEKQIGLRFPQIREKLGPDMLDKVLRSKKARLFAETHDLSEEVNTAVEAVAGRLSRSIKRFLGSAHSIHHVLFVGGGAEVFADVANEWPHARVIENPEFANVRGMLKLARMA